MRRKINCKRILMAGLALPAMILALGVRARAQSDERNAPPGMEDNSGMGAFSAGGNKTTSYGGRHDAPAGPAVSSFPGEVHGVTRYPSGLPMPGAEVVIINPDANIDRTIVSGSDGAFVFKNLKAGEYQLTAKKEGFDLSPVTKVELAWGKIASVDVPLGPSLAISPANPNPRISTFNQPTYRLQPASLHIAAAEPPANEAAPTANVAGTEAAKPATSAADPAIPAAVADELDAMRRRIDELEMELKSRVTPDPAAATPASTPISQDAQAPATPKPGPGQYLSTAGTITNYYGDTDVPSHPDGWEPFSYADWTWMNANGRQHDSPWSTKYFTPEFRADVNYMFSGNHPKDDTLGGSTESFRHNEFQLEQLSLGGDIRIGHVRGRILTMFGLFATTTPRNDGSVARGQWDLGNAYRYISEGWGGYHFDNIGHGLNVDAGIFVSYIGLFSYYNFDNWTYQPSYVSSNTPWFFNGLRIQYFPTAKLKIEPWFINGWQSYARFNSKPGLGGQILWRPKPYLSFVFNNYGMGTDVAGSPGVSRIHTDDSLEFREYNKPDNWLDMAAMSFTADAGCQYGGGPLQTTQNCFNDKNNGFKTAFLGYMAYQRFQFAHDHYGLTLGGGYLNNPGRYLTLLPPINGANAVTGSPYFTENPGDKYHAYDFTTTFDYMPSQWLTFRWEVGYRHADVPYFSGKNGITPPGGLPGVYTNTGSPASYVCTNGLSSFASSFTPSGSGFVSDNSGRGTNRGGAIDQSCAGQQAGFYAWAPNLVHSQTVATFAIMTRF